VSNGILELRIRFPELVELCPEDQRTLVELADRMCSRWEATHPGEVMWGSGVGFAILACYAEYLGSGQP
jgi:hypothetical protein